MDGNLFGLHLLDKIINFTFVLTIDQNIVDIDNYIQSRAKEQARIILRRCKLLTNKTFCDLLKKVAWGLTETIETAMQLENMSVLNLETTWLMDVYFFSWLE
jgi:hypothetical protein